MSSVARTVRAEVGSTAPTRLGPSRKDRRKRARSRSTSLPRITTARAASPTKPPLPHVETRAVLQNAGPPRRGAAKVGGEMRELALGAVLAVTASALFSAGLVLQSLEARTVPAEHSLRLSLIARLLGRPRWVLCGVLMVVAFGLHVGALL